MSSSSFPASILKLLWKGIGRVWSPKVALRHLFWLRDIIDRLIVERATAYGRGVNPKHRLTNYHDFFVQRISSHACVLDLGCGVGAVARTIAMRRPDALVVGVERDANLLRRAEAFPNPPNLSFLAGDILFDMPEATWGVVVLSNVLEHIEDRVAFLKRLAEKVKPEKILVRVPLFERDWMVPLRRELGVSYYSDPTHFIEHTLLEFDAEVAEAGLIITERQTLWGEIWAVLEPKR